MFGLCFRLFVWLGFLFVGFLLVWFVFSWLLGWWFCFCFVFCFWLLFLVGGGGGGVKLHSTINDTFDVTQVVDGVAFHKRDKAWNSKQLKVKDTRVRQQKVGSEAT